MCASIGTFMGGSSKTRFKCQTLTGFRRPNVRFRIKHLLWQIALLSGSAHLLADCNAADVSHPTKWSPVICDEVLTGTGAEFSASCSPFVCDLAVNRPSSPAARKAVQIFSYALEA